MTPKAESNPLAELLAMPLDKRIAARRQNASLTHWHKDAEAAGILAGALRNRQDNV